MRLKTTANSIQDMAAAMENVTRNTTSALESWLPNNSVRHALFGLNIFLSCVSIITNVVGNVIIIVSIHSFHWLKTPLYTTIQMLAIADLSTVIHTLNTTLRKFSWYPESHYYVANSFLLLTTGSAVFHVALTALERYIALAFPFKYRAYASQGLVRKISGVIWIISGIIALPDIYVSIGYHIDSGVFRSALKYVKCLFVLGMYVIIGAILISLYAKISSIARNQAELNCRRTSSSSMPAQNKRTTKMMIIIVGIYLILWAPFATSLMVQLFIKDDSDIIIYVQDVALAVGMFNSSVNILIYLTRSRKFREACRKLFNINMAAKKD